MTRPYSPQPRRPPTALGHLHAEEPHRRPHRAARRHDLRRAELRARHGDLEPVLEPLPKRRAARQQPTGERDRDGRALVAEQPSRRACGRAARAPRRPAEQRVGAQVAGRRDLKHDGREPRELGRRRLRGPRTISRAGHPPGSPSERRDKRGLRLAAVGRGGDDVQRAPPDPRAAPLVADDGAPAATARERARRPAPERDRARARDRAGARRRRRTRRRARSPRRCARRPPRRARARRGPARAPALRLAADARDADAEHLRRDVRHVAAASASRTQCPRSRRPRGPRVPGARRDPGPSTPAISRPCSSATTTRVFEPPPSTPPR